MILCIAVGTRLALLPSAQYPGYGDTTFYFNVAENLVDGRGFEVDWNWNYLNTPETITHPSYDYWMPLPSLIISIPMFILGKTLTVALLPSLLMSVILATVTWWGAKLYSSSKLVLWSSAGLVLFVPTLFRYSLVTDCVIYYACFASLSLFSMIKGQAHPRFFLAAALAAGLAYLSRQDGLLLVPTLLFAILFSPCPSKIKIATLTGALGLFLLVIAPLLAANYQTFHTLVPPGPSKTIFFTQYNDFFAASKTLTLDQYLDWGWRNIIHSKWSAGRAYVRQIAEFSGDLLNIFIVIGLARGLVFRRAERPMRYLIPLLFLGLLLVFYTLLATFPGVGGGFQRGAAALVPFMIVMAVEAIDHDIPAKPTAALALLLVACTFCYQSVTKTRASLTYWSEIGAMYAGINELLPADARAQVQEERIFMADYPWLVYYSTGDKALAVPSDDLETVYEVAQKYRVNYLLLTTPSSPAAWRLYTGQVVDERFELIASAAPLKLYRIRAEGR